jgi:chitinase
LKKSLGWIAVLKTAGVRKRCAKFQRAEIYPRKKLSLPFGKISIMPSRLQPFRRKLIKSFLNFALIVSFSTSIFAQEFKTIGYLPWYRFGVAELISYEKLTHLNLAFGYPDAEGFISVGGQDISPIVAMAHDHDLEVFLSIAGGDATTEQYWLNLLQPDNRSAFINKLVTFTRDHNLQGIDVDLEWNDVTENYSPFVLELKDTLDVYGLIMTAALPGSYRYPEVSDEALEAYEWINMMVYDYTGPWAPNSPGPHSSFDHAEAAITYWSSGQGVPTEKLTLGVPFYGYDFNDPGDVHSFTYASMVAQDTDYAEMDQVGLAFYNGRPTIEDKTVLALENLSGIMIWELGQDAFLSIEEYSLLETIFQTIQAYFVNTEDPVITLEFNAYPNPFGQELNLEHSGNDAVEVRLSNINGHLVWHQKLDVQQKTLNLSTQSIPAGFYILSVSDGNSVISRKLIKQ